MLNPDADSLLRLMFEDGEGVCVSPNKFGYYSLPLREIFNSEEIILTSPSDKMGDLKAPVSELRLCSINPCNGKRDDQSVTAYRSFLVEADDGPLAQQMEYIRQSGLPWSACVFSGNKSLHFAVVLDKPLPGYKTWRYIAEWILSALPQVDQSTKNPSRSIRLPGPSRGDKHQKLVKIRDRVSLDDLMKWLSKHPEARPQKQEEERAPSENPNFNLIAPWVKKELIEGIDESRGRNNRWFAIGCELALAGYSRDDIIHILEPYFEESSDFKRDEWLTALGSAYHKMRNKG